MKVFYKGIINSISKSGIIIETQHLGVYINVFDGETYVLESEVKIFVYEYFINGYKFIYGFKTFDQRMMFIDLLRVNKIGTKTALSIASRVEYNEFKKLILKQNHTEIKTKLNISDRLISSLIIELRNKYFKKSESEIKYEIISNSLLKLGYSETKINEILKEKLSSSTGSIDETIESIIMAISNKKEKVKQASNLK